MTILPNTRLADLKAGLEQCMLPDRVRLGRRLATLCQALECGKPPRRLTQDLDQIAERLGRSARTRKSRQRDLDACRLELPVELPISANADKIREAIANNPVVVIAGDTGSGKTTQIPKICLQAGRGRDASIAVTQPRRVAATSLSRRLAEELDVVWGRQVGAKIRFRDRTTAETLVKFLTDGMLLAEIRSDRDLLEYDTIIVDEAHERSLNIDFLLGYLCSLRQRRPELKIIVTSATIDTEAFSTAFDNAPVIEVSGRLYPVEVRHWPLNELLSDRDEFSYTDGAVAAVAQLLEETDRGDVLVFMPSERDIRETRDLIDRCIPRAGLEVLPLFSRLGAAEQHKVFGPRAGRRVVIATNIAETSLTIPGIRYVVDTGLARISRYNPRTGTQRLPIEEISRSSAEQRKGRCGRLQDGICIRLYSEDDLLARTEYTTPEIQRANLAEVILRMLALDLGKIELFPFVDPPKTQAIHGGYQQLIELGAIDEQRQLTRIGKDMARMPIAPAVSRMILQAHAEGALPEVLVIAAAISVQDPRERPSGQESEADAMHKQFADPRSDFLTLFNIWNSYHDRLENSTQSQMRKFCRIHFLSFVRMREWRDIHVQLEMTLEEQGGFRLDVSCLQRPDAFDAVHRSVLTGLLHNVARKRSESGVVNHYHATRGRRVMVFPGSGLFVRGGAKAQETQSAGEDANGQSPAWLVAAEMVETNRLFARTAAAIKPEWISDLGGFLCRSSFADPHWSRKAGRVLVYEIVRLHGLEVLKRRVGYAAISPREATDIFLREALIAGEVDGIVHPFFEHNHRLRQRLEVWQSRMRRHSGIDLEEAFHDFYAHHLPNGVGSVHDLNRVIKERGGDGFLHADEENLFSDADLRVDDEAFPDALELEGKRLPLSYAYQPGQVEDGITVRVPYRLVDSLPPEVLEWLVPGLRQEKITCLLRSLPKALRKRFVPIPQSAEALALEIRTNDGSFLDALEKAIVRRYDVQVRRANWDQSSVPEHLRMRVEVENTHGNVVAEGRDLTAIGSKLERPAEAPVELDAWKREVQRWQRENLIEWSIGDVPERVEVTEVSGIPVFAYSGLSLEDNAVHLRLFPSREQAREATPSGFQRLCELALKGEMAWLQRELMDLRSVVSQHASLGEPAQIEAQAYCHLTRYLFLRGELLPLTEDRFKARLADAEQELKGLSARFLGLLSQALELRLEIVACSRPYAELENDLHRLLPRGFLEHLDYERMPHLVRYLKAVRIRVDRFAADPARDGAKMRQVEPYARTLDQLRAGDGSHAERLRRIDEYRWMLEEFRVSVFAQELGTAQRVSAKRLEIQLEEVDKTGS
ncbi:MAG: ATP-dependent RNA helicase HrpA [Candidatus Latescibacterota bacterium]|nr:ATP-dependent RNA helicase HrpA [Candidatus Latescibacterota bacterium]